MAQTTQIVKKYHEERMRLTKPEELVYLETNFSLMTIFEEIKINEELKRKKELEERMVEEGADPDQPPNEQQQQQDQQQQEEDLGEDGQPKEHYETLRFYRAGLYEESKVTEIAKLPVGQSLQWNDFLMMTKSERIARAVENYNVFFILDIKKIKALGFNCKEMLQNCGVWLDNLSSQKGEQEILFPSGSYFKITSVKRNTKTHHQRVEISLEGAMYYLEMPDKEVPKKDQKGQQKDIKKKR